MGAREGSGHPSHQWMKICLELKGVCELETVLPSGPRYRLDKMGCEFPSSSDLWCLYKYSQFPALSTPFTCLPLTRILLCPECPVSLSVMYSLHSQKQAPREPLAATASPKDSANRFWEEAPAFTVGFRKSKAEDAHAVVQGHRDHSVCGLCTYSFLHTRDRDPGLSLHPQGHHFC